MFTQEQAKTITNSFVAICTPCYGGQVHEKHYVSVVSFVIASMKNGMNFTIETTGSLPCSKVVLYSLIELKKK